MTQRGERNAKRPEPIGHLHSNGDFCLDRMPQAPVWWPIPLYQEAEGSATDSPAEPVGEVFEREYDKSRGVAWAGEIPAPGTKLYAQPVAAPAEPVAWLWRGLNHTQAFVTKPPPSMLSDPSCTPLYARPVAAPEPLTAALKGLLDARHEGRLVADAPGSEGYIGSLVEAGERALATQPGTEGQK
jgi:hypothetical protein